MYINNPGMAAMPIYGKTFSGTGLPISKTWHEVSMTVYINHDAVMTLTDLF